MKSDTENTAATETEDEDFFDLEASYLDIEKINEGTWVSLGAEFKTLEVYVRGITSPGAKAMMMRLEREAPKKKRLRGGALTQKAYAEIVKQVVQEECILDWRGMYAGKGKSRREIPFSKKTLDGIMTEPRTDHIAGAMVDAVMDLQKTTIAAEETVSGNSEAS